MLWFIAEVVCVYACVAEVVVVMRCFGCGVCAACCA